MSKTMSKKSSDIYNDGLKLVSYCPVCETRYNPMEAQMLGNDGETHLLHVRCQSCHNSVLALVLVNQVGASSVGLLTDLSHEDVMRFKDNGVVSVNDVIDLHAFLEHDQFHKQFAVPIKRRSRRVNHKKEG